MKPQRESSKRVLRRLTAFAVGSCACTGAHSGTVSFAPQQPFPTSSAPYWVATADINGDGKLDAITANYNIAASGAAVLLNASNIGASTPTFDAWQGFATELNSTMVVTDDINGDNKPDLIVADKSGVVSVLLNTTANGAGLASFAPQQFYSVGPNGGEQPVAVATADINDDGRPDVIVADQASGKFSVLLNTTPTNATTPSFGAHVDFLTGTGATTTMPRFVAVADINGDGKPDVIVANRGENTFSVFFNTTIANAATPTFSTQPAITTGSTPTCVVADDVNGDGKPDLIVANVADNTVSVLLNTTANGSNSVSFATQLTFPAGGIGVQSSFSLATADIDGDTRPDIIVANRSDNLVAVLINTTTAHASTPSFAIAQTFATGSYPQSVAAGDVNGDGKLDLITSNIIDNSISVLLNTTTADRIFSDGFQ